jgi:hypothetical protein
MRVLIAYEESHHVYRDAIVSVIRALRPHVEVEVADLGALEAEVERLDPHLVVSSRPNTVDPGGRAAWYKLSHEPHEESDICLGGQRSGSHNPRLEELLRIIDQTEELVRTGRDLTGC